MAVESREGVQGSFCGGPARDTMNWRPAIVPARPRQRPAGDGAEARSSRATATTR